ncbi:DUF952 domain-containing protein [Nakamurella leprariae]|uniref:DUF952 domain-containing protein n=1 Tax=Nakamurella leprariae TaxID=2803911 RepID=A0A939BYL4_9ACTN|nr:DUF952 domain-containing protein [Nakamurella leprariae]MBM9466751.1 DUF952 domain-containing protein [Nakamurella leprariae]
MNGQVDPNAAGRLLYHCATEADWAQARRDGESRVSTRGRTLEQEGFLHCSFASQVPWVLESFYADVTEPMVLLAIDPAAVGARVAVEAPAGPPGASGPSGAASAERGFPHLYGPLPVAAVVQVVTLTRTADGWAVPELRDRLD